MKEKPKILIVDDKDENIVALERMLSGLDADFIRAMSGQEALAATLVNDFALALIDVQMPDMDGYETVMLLRQNDKTKLLPIIFVSAIYKDDYYQVKGIEAGAFDFIAKPIVPEVLIGKVRMFLDLHEHIVERKRVEDELRITQEKNQALLDAIPDLIFRINNEGVILDYHVSMENELYATPDKIVGKKVDEIVPDGIGDMARHHIEETLNTGATPIFEYKMDVPKGSRNFEARFVKSGYHEATVIIRDITEQKQIEELLIIQRGLAITLSSTSNLRESLGLILDAVLSIEGIDSGGVYIVDEETMGLDLYSHAGLSRKFIKDVIHLDPDSPQTAFVLQRKSKYFNSKEIESESDEFVKKEGLSALGIIPVYFDEKVVAVLNVASHTASSIPDNIRVFIEAIAAQIGSVILRLKAMEMVLESQNNLQAMFDSIEDFIFVFDTEGRVIDANPSAKDRLGYPTEELTNSTIFDLHPQDQKEEVVKKMSGMFSGTETVCAIPLMAKDGTLIPIETKVTRGRWGGEDVFFGISRDVTEQKRIEEERRKHRERLELILEGAELGVWDLDIKTGALFYNERFAEMFGYKPSEIKPDIKEWRKLLHPDEREGVLETIYDHIRGRTPFYELEYRFLSKSKEWRWVYARGKVVERDNDGKALRATGTHLDITDRKLAAEALRESEAKLRTIIDNSPDFTIWIDREGKIEYINRVIESHRKEDVIGTEIYSFIQPEQHDDLRNKIEKVFRTSEVISSESGGPENKWFITRFVPLIKNEQVSTVMLFATDITNLKKAKQELVRAKDAAEEASMAKSVFLANMSHELRTPMNAIIGISKMLGKHKATNLTEKQTEGLQLIHESGNRLLRLINELLDLSKIEAGEMKVILNSFSLSELIADQEKMILGLTANKNIDFLIYKESTVPDMIVSDSQKLNQVLTNLLGNSVKFTEEGKITLKIYAKGDRLYFEVEDTGIGVSEDDLPHIFDQFRQVDNSISKRYQGTGLGLTLSRELVTLLNGKISVESKLNVGTNVSFFIPCQIEEPRFKKIDAVREDNDENQEFGEQEKEHSPSISKIRVLVAEDDRIGRKTIKMMLHPKYHLTFAKNGKETIGKFVSFEPDIVLMDIMMPDMSGYEAFDQIRKIESRKHVPAIAVTASAMKGEKEKILGYGFDGYISKPIDDELLYKTIENLLSQARLSYM